MEALQKHRSPLQVPRTLGAILIDSGALQAQEAEKILALQKSEPGLRFGDAAMRLGLVQNTDVQRALAEQFVYPFLPSGDPRISQSVIAAFNPFHRVVEQMRVLRSQLLIRWFDNSDNKAISVISPSVGDGKSFVAANLAVVFSQLGQKTLLIDGDLRNPSQHALFKLPAGIGLSSVLAERASLSSATVNVSGLLDLSVLAAGPVPPNPHELLSRSAFDRVMNECQSRYDVVILDTPNGTDYPDAMSIARRTHGVVAVAAKSRTQVKALQDLVGLFSNSGITIVGATLNQV